MPKGRGYVVVWCWGDRWGRGGGVDTCNPDPDLYFLEIEITKSLDSHIALPKICIKFLTLIITPPPKNTPK